MNDMKYRNEMPYPIVMASNCKKDAELLMNVYGGCEASELSGLMQYIYQSYWLKNCYPEIADILKNIAMVEMHHHALLGKAIVDNCGDPIISGANMCWWKGDCVCYQKEVICMLKKDIMDEQTAIMAYKKLICCICNPSIRALLERIILDEEHHICLLNMACSMLMQNRVCKKQQERGNCGCQNMKSNCCNMQEPRQNCCDMNMNNCCPKNDCNMQGCGCNRQESKQNCCDMNMNNCCSKNDCNMQGCGCNMQEPRQNCCDMNMNNCCPKNDCNMQGCGCNRQESKQNCCGCDVENGDMSKMQMQVQSLVQDVEQMRDIVQMHAKDMQNMCNGSQGNGGFGGMGRINKI